MGFRARAGRALWLLSLLPPVDPVAVEVHQVLVVLEGVGEDPVLQEVFEIVELLALAARDAGDVVDNQQVGLPLAKSSVTASNTNFSVSPIVSGGL